MHRLRLAWWLCYRSAAMAAQGSTILTTPKFRVERAARAPADWRVPRRKIVMRPGAAAILALATPKSVVLVENERVTVPRPLLELPAWTLEEGESPSALRERSVASINPLSLT